MDKIMVIDVDGQKGTLTLRTRDFKTGSKGFMVFGKIIIDGKRYQVMGNVVEIGSRPKEDSKSLTVPQVYT